MHRGTFTINSISVSGIRDQEDKITLRQPDEPADRRDRDMTTENYSLRLDAQRRRKLQDIARRQDRDMAYIIRKAIDDYIERHEDDDR